MVDREVILSVVAIFVYIVGGIGTFCGAGLILLMRGKDLWGTGGRGILWVTCLSVLVL